MLGKTILSDLVGSYTRNILGLVDILFPRTSGRSVQYLLRIRSLSYSYLYNAVVVAVYNLELLLIEVVYSSRNTIYISCTDCY
jgi:hypothetical protein